MSTMEWIGLLLSIGVGIYLCVALFLPEKFQ
jgi:K+-transporting ATPase KdpF subunit